MIVSSRSIVVIGHRGACGYYPENTLLSLSKAIEMGVDAVEFDVRMTRDGVLVLFHDEKLDRLLKIRGYLREKTYSYISRLSIRGEKIPTLEEALSFLKDKKVNIVIEIKEPDTVEKILDVVKRSGIEKSRIMFVSFHHEILHVPKSDGYRVGAIFVCRPRKLSSMFQDFVPDVVLPRYDMLDEALVKEAHDMGMMVGTWVINDEQDLMRVLRLGVDMVASDYPDKIIRALRQSRLF